MAKKKKDESGVVEVLPGTVEHARQEYFAREKAAYEERTGETVNFELSAPLTSTPIVEPASEDESEGPGEPADPIEAESPEGDQ